MNYKPFFIDKSYVEKAYIAPVDQAWSEVRFSFHPMLPVERARYNEELGNVQKKAALAEALLARTLASRITEWNLCDEDGNPVEITAENILRMRFYTLIDKMANIVCWGTDVGDVDPNATVSDLEDMEQLERLAGDRGDISKARDEALTKN